MNEGGVGDGEAKNGEMEEERVKWGKKRQNERPKRSVEVWCR